MQRLAKALRAMVCMAALLIVGWATLGACDPVVPSEPGQKEPSRTDLGRESASGVEPTSGDGDARDAAPQPEPSVESRGPEPTSDSPAPERQTPEPAPDARTPDVGTPDGGTPDGGTPDGGTPDGGTPDAPVTGPGPCVQKTPQIKPYTGADASRYDACGAGYDFPCPSQHKSGISLQLAGKIGKTYAEEYLFFDKKVDDTRVIYLRSTTKIKLFHNSNNTIFSTDANNGGAKPTSLNAGKIRYKVDRDLQFRYVWAPFSGNTRYVLPAYTGPFSLSQLSYEAGVPVVGTVGPAPGASIKDRDAFYWRGHKGPFGDEWHTLQFADDDSHLGGGGTASEKWSSDGKIASLVVNPRHPVLQLRASQPGAQFYTTPAKIYFMPKIHEQRSYVTKGVTLHLANITNDKAIHYRIDSGAWQLYSRPISTDSWAPGTHTVYYTYNPCFIKKRVFVKDPPFASQKAQKFWLGYSSAGAFAAIQKRMLSGDLNGTFAKHKRNLQRDLQHKGADGTRAPYKNGQRKDGLGYAVIALVEGLSKAKDWAIAAKRRLLSSDAYLPRMGQELNDVFEPSPNKQRYYRGYYDVNVTFDMAFTYSLLIKHFRSDQHAGGITAIEDLRIRDAMAGYAIEGLMELGAYAKGASTSPELGLQVGMWGSARQMGALAVALAMPGYHTPYLGTSGFDGTKATHKWTPYPDHPSSWKDAFATHFDPKNPTHRKALHGYPNQQSMFNWYHGGLIRADGSFHDRIPYYDFHLMGHCFQIFSNLMAMHLPQRSLSYLHKSFDLANKGQLKGNKFGGANDRNPHYFPLTLLINNHAPAHIKKGAQANFTTNRYKLSYELYRSGAVWMLYYHP